MTNIFKRRRQLRKKDNAEIKRIVAKKKRQRKAKHSKSKIRHPIKAVKRSSAHVTQTTAESWEQGKILAKRRAEHTPEYYVPDKAIIKHGAKTYAKMSFGKKVMIAVVVICVLVFLGLGVVSDYM